MLDKCSLEIESSFANIDRKDDSLYRFPVAENITHLDDMSPTYR